MIDTLGLVGKRIFIYRQQTDDQPNVDGTVIAYDDDMWTLEDRMGRKFTVPRKSPSADKQYAWAEERK